MKTIMTHGATALALVLTAAPAGAHDLLPLGDGKISASPQQGYLYSCQQQFNPNAPGAQREGPWIQGDQWHPHEKVVVEGAVTWPNAYIAVTREGTRRIVRANNLPTHPTGEFPVAANSTAAYYDRNPGSIREQDILLDLPALPQRAAEPSCVPMGMIGFTLSGGALYNAVDARGDDAPAHEIQDRCGGHPQQTGQYHYHNRSDCLTDTRSQPDGHSDILGYALDGFGIFGTTDRGGVELTNAALDACHGHSHTLLWDGEMVEMYHYHFTREYPYSLGCFSGTPIDTPFSMEAPGGQQGGMGQGGPRQGGMQQGQQPQGMQGGGPRQGGPLAAAAAELGVSEQALMQAVGAPPPDFERAARVLGIPAARIRAVMEQYRPGGPAPR